RRYERARSVDGRSK
ncbi:hypothetical protein SpAB1_14290, partial [Streptococcus pyogenes]